MELEVSVSRCHVYDGDELIATVSAIDEYASTIEINAPLGKAEWEKLYWAVRKALLEIHGGIDE